MYFEYLKNLLIIALATSILTSALIQKIKENLKTDKYIVLIGFIVNIIIGPLFAISFCNITVVDSLWVGLFSFVGADILYQTFEDKIFKSFTNLKKDISIPIENNIKQNDE